MRTAAKLATAADTIGHRLLPDRLCRTGSLIAFTLRPLLLDHFSVPSPSRRRKSCRASAGSPAAASTTAGLRSATRQLDGVPFTVNEVGEESFEVKVPWKPNWTLPPGGMLAL